MYSPNTRGELLYMLLSSITSCEVTSTMDGWIGQHGLHMLDEAVAVPTPLYLQRIVTTQTGIPVLHSG